MQSIHSAASSNENKTKHHYAPEAAHLLVLLYFVDWRVVCPFRDDLAAIQNCVKVK